MRISDWSSDVCSSDLLVNTPQCIMAEGLADLALEAIVGPDWGLWAQDIYADLGLSFDGEKAQRISDASGQLLSVRQDASLRLPDEGRSLGIGRAAGRGEVRRSEWISGGAGP